MRTLLSALAVSMCVAAQTVERPVRSVTDPGVVTTRQTITPAGVPTIFQGRVYGVAFGASSNELWVANATRLYRLDWQANRVLDSLPLEGTPGLQSLQYDAVNGRVLAGVTAKNRRTLLVSAKDGRMSPVTEALGAYPIGALAVAAKPNGEGRRVAVVPLTRDNQLAVIDLEANQIIGKAATGIAPFGAVVNGQGTAAYVSNWGGRRAVAGERTAPTGLAPDADQVVINEQGIAATGTVTRIDLGKLQPTHTIAVELHPTAMVWDEEHARLYVANGNRDSVSVIDTEQNRVAATWRIQPFEQKVAGIAPTALALGPGGRKLYVACGGINAVAVLDVPAGGRIDGLIPTGWYPNGLSLSADGRRLAVASLLGAGSGWREEPRKRFVHAYRGSVSVLDLPNMPQLASYTTAVAENNHLRIGSFRRLPEQARKTAPVAIPARAGEPSLIEHVVYIVKENRTYDQVLGDIAKGNGDPSLVMFGEPITPNQHRLANQFVLLDNFFATGGNSGDGHQWVTQANETDYCLWPGYAGRSYPFDGTDPIAYSEGGFLWDAALKLGKTVRVYGEYVPRVESKAPRLELLERWQKGEDFSRTWQSRSPIPTLDRLLARSFPGYSTTIPDVIRAQIFLADLKRWEAEGRMPNLTLIQLPSNHTSGASPGHSTPQAMVADNDLALGRIVEALSRSRFWRKMAIFVVEDDAQNGVDHVDGHRTIAFAISPYIKRGHIDSTFYSHQSIVKTIELILGLPTLSLFDLIANDMRASFQDEPDMSPYSAVTPSQSLFDMNPPVSALKGEARKAAIASAKMRWDVPDAAPTARLNRIVWHMVKGWNTPYPAERRAVFAPLAVDLDDDER